MIEKMEKKRLDNLKTLADSLSEIEADEPIEFLNELEEEIYRNCAYLKDILTDYLNT